MTLATVSFQTEFAVDMTCENCVESVSSSLKDVQGIERYDIDLAKKRVTITGRAPPSSLLQALKSTNRQVLVRGTSSTSQSPSLPIQAAVSILESPLPLPTSLSSPSTSSINPDSTLPSINHGKGLAGMNEEEHTQKVFGIARFVQIAPKLVLMDLTVRLPPPSRVGLAASSPAGSGGYNVYISTLGNMVNPPITTGKSLLNLGKIIPDKDGYGDLFKEVEGELWEWIGRGCVVESESSSTTSTSTNLDEGAKDAKGIAERMASPSSSLGKIFAGVVARSAGAWGNEKTVCACSGRTMWEEGRDMESKGL